MQEIQVQSLGQEEPLEPATHTSSLILVGVVCARHWDRCWKYLKEPTNSHLLGEADHKIIGIQHKLFSSVQLFSCVRLFVTPWTAACQASLSFTISQSLLKLMSIELLMPSNHLILCCPILFLPSIFLIIILTYFPISRLFASGGQNIGASASASVLPMNIQGL